MNTRESAPIEGEAVTEQIKTFRPDNIPESWKDKYQGIRVVWDREQPYRRKIVGVYEEAGVEQEEELDPEELIDIVEDPHEFTSMRWTDDELSQNPALAEAARENAELRAVMYMQEEEIARLGDVQNSMLGAIDRYHDQIRLFTRQVDELTQRNIELERRINDVENATTGRPQTVVNPTTEDDGIRLVAASAMTPKPTAAPKAKPIPRIVVEPTPTSASADEITEGEPIESPVPEEEPGRWNRFRGKIGNAVLGTQVRAQNGMYRMVNREGDVVTNDEIIDTEIEERRRVGTGVLIGGVAVIGAGILGYWLAKHTGQSPSSKINEIYNQNTTIKGQNSQLVEQLNTLKAQDKTAFERMSQRIAEMKRTVNANHNLLVYLKHHEAREAIATRNVSYSGATHSEYLSYYGDTPWDHARRWIEQRTGRTPNENTIRRVTSRILSMSGIRWNGGGFNVDSHLLPIGRRLIVPNRVS